MSEGGSGGERISAAEVIAALSLATDLSIGFDFEHGLRSTLVAVRLAERLDVERETAAHSYLRDVGEIRAGKTSALYCVRWMWRGSF